MTMVRYSESAVLGLGWSASLDTYRAWLALPYVLVGLWVLGLSAGCPGSNSTKCHGESGDWVCPPHLQCHPVHECVSTAQLAACIGIDDGDRCETTEIPAGWCDRGVCVALACGDGAMNAPEECDGADLAGSTCESLGFHPGTLACSETCTFDTTACGGACGDGTINGDEQCDDGNTEGNDGCSASCTLWESYIHVDYAHHLAIGDTFAWAATSSGLLRIDLDDPGQVRRFTMADGLPSNGIRTVTWHDGWVYLATRHGVTIIDRDGVIQSQLTEEDHEGLSEVNEILISSDGALWLATDLGAVVLRPDQTWLHIRLHTDYDLLGLDSVRLLSEACDGNVWIAWLGACRVTSSGEVLECLTTSTPPPGQLTRILILDLLTDNDCRTWFALHREGIDVYDRVSMTMTHYEEGDAALPHNDVRALTTKGSGEIWAGTSNGLCRINTVSGLFATDTMSQRGPLAAAVEHIVSDGQSNIWAATAAGVSRFDGYTWFDVRTTDVSHPATSDSWIQGLAVDSRGRVWLASPDGVTVFDGLSWDAYGMSDGIPGRLEHMVVAPDDQVWVGTNEGVASWSAGLWTTYPETGTTGEVSYLAVDPDNGDIWVAKWCGSLWRWNSYDWTYYSLADSGTGCIGAMAVSDDGKIWLSDAGGGAHGIFLFDPGTGLADCYNAEGSNGCEQVDFLPSKTFNLTVHQGVLWGSWPTLFSFDGVSWEIYDQAAGFPAPEARGLVFDDVTDTMWIGALRYGLVRYRDGVFTTFTDPATPEPAGFYNLALDSMGQVWASTNGGARLFYGE